MYDGLLDGGCTEVAMAVLGCASRLAATVAPLAARCAMILILG